MEVNYILLGVLLITVALLLFAITSFLVKSELSKNNKTNIYSLNASYFYSDSTAAINCSPRSL